MPELLYVVALLALLLGFAVFPKASLAVIAITALVFIGLRALKRYRSRWVRPPAGQAVVATRSGMVRRIEMIESDEGDSICFVGIGDPLPVKYSECALAPFLCGAVGVAPGQMVNKGDQLGHW